MWGVNTYSGDSYLKMDDHRCLTLMNDRQEVMDPRHSDWKDADARPERASPSGGGEHCYYWIAP